MSKWKYNIIVIGCAMNKSDSERIAGYLERLSFEEAERYHDADLAIIATCGVRQSPEDRIYGLVTAIGQANPKTRIVITGCLSKEKVVHDRVGDKVDIWLSIDELPTLRQKLAALPDFKILSEFDSDTVADSSYLSIHPKYKSLFTAFVPIGNGCDNFCSYCYVPYARGRETYRKAEDIVKEVEGLSRSGYKEIVLIAQNVNSYRDGKKDFTELLALVDNVPGDFWIRFSTSHPKDMSDELIKKIASLRKVCRYIHLPVQSGDDEVLRRMNRNYTRDHYLKLLHKIRYEFDEKKTGARLDDDWRAPVSVTTDCIVGFPGETNEQFENTRRLFEEARFDMAYIAQYSPRPKTVSAKMVDDVVKEEKKRREDELTQILKKTSRNNNQCYIDKTLIVLAESLGRKKDILGRTETNKIVKIEGGNVSHIGSFLKVKITEADTFGLKGLILPDNN